MSVDVKVAGGRAFPSGATELDYLGITKRDYFAAKAMAAIVGNDSNFSSDEAPAKAALAYAMADAMLAAREA